jgi:hypothetical protein
MKTRKIVIGMHAGMAGTDSWEFWIVPEDVSDDTLSDFVWETAKNHAESYGVYPECEYTDEEIAKDPESYSDNIEGWYEVYDAAKHDMHSISGTPHWSKY